MELRSLLFSFYGRIGRGQFWLGTFFAFLIGLVLIVPAVLIEETTEGLSIILMLAGQILSTIVSLAVDVKRCHDRGKSGWWVLLLFIPLVGIVWWLIELGMLEGETGPNIYGPDPRAPLEAYEHTFR